MSRPRWLIIDVSNWAYGILHKCGPGAHSLNTFAKRAEFYARRVKPERTILAFDSGESFRSRLLPTYKAQRREKPHGLRALLDQIRELAIANEWDVVSAEGFEADDCIATVTQIAVDMERNVLIAALDKDLKQLILRDRVAMLREMTASGRVPTYTWKDFREEHGIDVAQWIDYQTLVGDSTDNIPGCPGIGHEKAMSILTKCSSLDEYYKNVWAANLSNSDRNRLLRFNGDERQLMRRLVTLRRDVPLPAAWREEGVAS